MLRTPVTDMRSYYAEHFAEGDRLQSTAHGRLEFLRTQEILRAHLPPAPARVLDVGGATGVHARWLAADGYAVHVVDPMPEHVTAAAAIPEVTAAVGDARRLAEPDGGADVTLLLGPLYHLVERTDRVQALQEARRVTAPGGLVVAAAISRHALPLDKGARSTVDDEVEPLLRAALATGRHDARLGFTTAHLHHADELAAEMRAAGLQGVDVLGVEGPLTTVLYVDPRADDERFAAVRRVARLLERDPAVIATSPHLLGLARP
jgi:SAM-dependent methyltransferase